jgi:hypothetical protein
LRISPRAVLSAVLLAASCATVAPRALAQDDQFLMPEQSAAKAKQIIDQAIEALGGNAYRNVHDATCTGRIGTFDHSGEVTGFGRFVDYAQPPFKERQENLPKRNIIDVYNGDKGWSLDRGGVSDEPRSEVADFQETVRKDIDNILRHRIHEPGMVFRYAGPDTVDLKQAEWVELIDTDNRTIRIAFSMSTHLPVRKTVDTRDPKTQMKSQETEYYSNYHPLSGIQTAFQIARERNGIKLFQVFFDTCEYNTNLADAMFTKESLDQRWSQVGKKEMEKEKKKDKDDKDKDAKADKEDKSDTSSDRDKDY